MVEVHQNDADGGVHSAAELLLSRWGYADRLKNNEAAFAAGSAGLARRWYVNPAGQTIVLIDGPIEFEMGSRPTDPNGQMDEPVRRVQIPRRFAIAAKEVTIDQFQAYAKETRVDLTTTTCGTVPIPKVPRSASVGSTPRPIATG